MPLIAKTHYLAGSIDPTRILNNVRYTTDLTPQTSFSNDSNITGLCMSMRVREPLS